MIFPPYIFPRFSVSFFEMLGFWLLGCILGTNFHHLHIISYFLLEKLIDMYIYYICLLWYNIERYYD